MDNKQAIEQLKDLKKFKIKFVNEEKVLSTEESKKEIEALDIAIKALERTALEVPVQEQLKKRKILLIQSLGKENFESIVDEVNKIIKEYNLNTTPTILIDLLNYIGTVTLL